MGIDEFLGIRYKLTTSENFDDYMKELGVGLITRKMGNAVSPTVTLTEENGTYTLTTSSSFKTTVVKFQPGVEFDEETADGRKVKSVITFDGTTMNHIQKGDKETTIVREYTDKQMKAIMTVGTIVCTRVYDKVD